MIRVLFVLGSLAGGGAERQTLTWLRYLNRAAFSPSLYVISRRGQLASQVPTDIKLSAYEDRHSPPKLYFPGRNFRSQGKDLTAMIAEQRIDVIVSVSLHMTLLVESATDRSISWIAVEMADPRLDFTDQIRRFRTIKRRRLAKGYRNAIPVAVSLGVKQGLEHFYRLPANSIHVIPNFIDVAAIDLDIAEARRPPDEEKFRIITVGRLQPQKGHRYLLDAMKVLVYDRSLRQLHLHLLGDGPLRHELENQVSVLNLQNHVTFEGFVDRPAPFLHRCNLFCLPSLYEGLPLALLEAMACNVPVVATDCQSGPKEILQNGKYGRLVPVGAVEPLADAIEHAVRDPEALKQTAIAARCHVETEYSVPVGMARLETLLEQAAREGK